MYSHKLAAFRCRDGIVQILQLLKEDKTGWQKLECKDVSVTTMCEVREECQVGDSKQGFLRFVYYYYPFDAIETAQFCAFLDLIGEEEESISSREYNNQGRKKKQLGGKCLIHPTFTTFYIHILDICIECTKYVMVKGAMQWWWL